MCNRFFWLKVGIAVCVVSLAGSWFYISNVQNRSLMSFIVDHAMPFVMPDRSDYARALEAARQKNSVPYQLPGNIKFVSRIEKHTLGQNDYYILTNPSKTETKRILYLHGGGYVHQAAKEHWQFVDRLVSETGASVVLPVYPKAPDHQFQEAFKMVEAVYRRMLKETESSKITIMGDSAGGGFALAFAEMLRDNKLPQPGKIIMISPWLDLSLKNPDIAKQIGLDSMLGKDPQFWAFYGSKWAGGADPGYYMLSPLHGDIRGLGKMYLFIGTHELFLPDARKFKQKADDAGIQIGYYEYPYMGHVFPLLPIPEAERARKQMVKIINEN